MLPPGMIRPLPGEVLPGSNPGRAGQSAPPNAEALAPPGPVPPGQPMPPQALPSQRVPPPPWRQRQGAQERDAAPWAWLLLGLGLGVAAMVLLQPQGRRPGWRPGRSAGRSAGQRQGTLPSLGFRVEPRPDPGVSSLRPLASAAPAPGGEPAAGAREV
jgi:hypothetical protein